MSDCRTFQNKMHIKLGDEEKRISDQCAKSMKCQSHIRYRWFFIRSFASFALFLRLSCAYFDQNITSAVVSYAVVRINRSSLLYMNVMHVSREKETQRCAASEWLLVGDDVGRFFRM